MTIADEVRAADLDQLLAIAREIGQRAEPFAAVHDVESSFVTEGYGAIRDLNYGTMAVPAELGGGGYQLGAITRAQAVIARYCANTALGIAMHQHATLSMAWRWRMGDEGVEPVLRRIADGLILASSGAMDLNNPGVNGRRIADGLMVSGRKGYASGCPGADVLATPLLIEGEPGPASTSVLIPMTAPGVTILDNWNAMGMRGSGSNSVDIVDVFVPDDNILSPQRAAGGRSEVRRPQPALTNGSPSTPEGVRRAHRIPGLMIALPVIASCYLGIAAGVRDRAMRQVGLGRKARDPATARLAGLMTAHYRAAQWAMDGLIGETRDDTLASEQQFITTMIGKREVVLRSIAVVETAMEMLGAMTYARSQPYEQALRDIRAGITHPLAPEATLSEVGQTVLARVGRQAGREAGSRPTRAAPEQVARQETSGA